MDASDLINMAGGFGFPVKLSNKKDIVTTLLRFLVEHRVEPAYKQFSKILSLCFVNVWYEFCNYSKLEYHGFPYILF